MRSRWPLKPLNRPEPPPKVSRRRRVKAADVSLTEWLAAAERVQRAIAMKRSECALRAVRRRKDQIHEAQ